MEEVSPVPLLLRPASVSPSSSLNISVIWALSSARLLYWAFVPNSRLGRRGGTGGDMIDSLLLLRVEVNDFDRGRNFMDAVGVGSGDDVVALVDEKEGSFKCDRDFERRTSARLRVGVVVEGVATGASDGMPRRRDIDAVRRSEGIW